MFRYITVKEAAGKWGITERRIQRLCEEGRIDGLQRFGRSWMIPEDARKPDDLRRRKQMKCKKVVKNYVQSAT